MLLCPAPLTAGETTQPSEQAPTKAQQKAQQEAEKPYQHLRLFGYAFDLIKREYVENPDNKELIEAAIDGMLRSLDPHSAYLNAQDFEEMKLSTRGDFGGLGIEVTMENGLVKVVSPIDDTPAAKAGIKSGDFITDIDSTPVFGLSLDEAVSKMRGTPGTEITLTIFSPNPPEGAEQTKNLTIVRAKIDIKPIKASLKEGDLGYIRISAFNEKTGEELEDSLKQLKASEELKSGKLKGLVLDLRNNPGGLLDQAIKVADLFLNEGEIVLTKGRDGKDTNRWSATTQTAVGNAIPIVVLINNGSASASEIVAGALQDHRRAVIMGTKSFGKGTVQTVRPIRTEKGESAAIRISTARYYTPLGRSIQAKGIEPDITVLQAEVKPIDNPTSPLSEANLRGALDAVMKKADPDAKTTAEPIDYQLTRALDLLKGLNLTKS